MRHKRVTIKSVDDSGEYLQAVFSSGGYIAADGEKALGALHGSEAAGDLLLHLDHADILFGKIVGEGDARVVQKRQHPGFVLLQAVEQVLRFCLFFSSAFFLLWGRGGLGVCQASFSEERAVASVPVG